MSINSGLLQKLITFGFLTAGTFAMGATSASAACPTNGFNNEFSLDGIINDTDCDFRLPSDTFNNLVDSPATETFSVDDFSKSKFWLEFEFAGDASGNEVGVYKVGDTSITKMLFAGSVESIDEAGLITSNPGKNRKTKVHSNFFAGFGSDFGFYLKNAKTGTTFYSESAENSDGLDYAKVFLGDGEAKFDVNQNGGSHDFHLSDFIIAFEDRAEGEKYDDFDYNDSILFVHRTPEDVPEPATLLGLSLVAGAFGVIRKRDRN